MPIENYFTISRKITIDKYPSEYQLGKKFKSILHYLNCSSVPTTTQEPEPEYEYYYEYIYEEDLPQFSENLPPSTTFETETSLPTKQTLLETSSRFSEPPHTASNGKFF